MNWEQVDVELLRCGDFRIERVMLDLAVGWYELTHRGRIAAQLGLFHVDDGRGRFHMVQTLKREAARLAGEVEDETRDPASTAPAATGRERAR